MSRVYELADRYVDDYANLDPTYATISGVEGYDDRLTDYSPDAIAERTELLMRYRRAMSEAEAGDARDRIARSVFIERADQRIEYDESGESFRELAVLLTPMQSIRRAFDVLPRDTTDHWKVIARRMTAVPGSIASIIASLRRGQAEGLSVSRRQALACARQARVTAGTEPESPRYFGSLSDEYAGRPGWDRKVEDALRKGAAAADVAYNELGDFLLDEYAPKAPDADGVGRERYAVATRRWLGAQIDAVEAYEWGWDELARLEGEVAAQCHAIAPGSSYVDVVAQLNDDHERSMHGSKALKSWLESLLARTVAELNGKHFDIPEPLQRIEVRAAPPGTAASRYYVPPSDDFARPGTYWFPTVGRTRFPLWKEMSTAYHEGAPGHHFQMGYVKFLRDELSAFQRNIHIAGYSEGWAMYAERLMGELGYFDRPEYRLDMLSNSLMRAARVVVDIGLHLSLDIPAAAGFHGGERWTPELAYEFMRLHSAEPPEFISSEIERYLGLPAQAITYKLGEKVWIEARAAAQSREGSEFSLKQFHSRALSLGPMGLDVMKAELVGT